MTTPDLVQGARVWMAVLCDQHPEEYRELLLELSQQEQQPARQGVKTQKARAPCCAYLWLVS